MTDFAAALARKYDILGMQAQAQKTDADARARLLNSQADTNPMEAAAKSAALRGQAAAGFGAGSQSQAQAGLIGENTRLAGGLANSEIGLRSAQAGNLDAEAAKSRYMITPNADAIRQHARNLGYQDAPGTTATGLPATIPSTSPNFISAGTPAAAAPPTDNGSTPAPNTNFLSLSDDGFDVNDPFGLKARAAGDSYVGGHASGTSYVIPIPQPGGPATAVGGVMPAVTPGFQAVGHVIPGLPTGQSALNSNPYLASGYLPGNAAGNSKIKGGKRGLVDATDGKGKVPGKGDGKTDTQLSALAPGEAVLNAAAAEHLGRPVIDLLNAAGAEKMGLDQQPNQPGKVPVSQLQNVPGHASGTDGGKPAGKSGPPVPAGKKNAPAAKSGGRGKNGKAAAISPAMIAALAGLMKQPSAPLSAPGGMPMMPGALPQS